MIDIERAKVEDCDRIIDGNVPETTGKFGTGFLTTHLLSRVVDISGVYQNAFDKTKYHKFNIRLDRTPENKEEMIEKYEEAFNQLTKFDRPEVCPLV